jgi:hypothetical protein
MEGCAPSHPQRQNSPKQKTQATTDAWRNGRGISVNQERAFEQKLTKITKGGAAIGGKDHAPGYFRSAPVRQITPPTTANAGPTANLIMGTIVRNAPIANKHPPMMIIACKTSRAGSE